MRKILNKITRYMIFSAVCFLFSLIFISGISAAFDVNGDGKTGLEEAIYALQVVAGIKTDCKERLDDETLSKVTLSFEPSVQMKPGETYNFYLGITECCYFFEPVEGGCPVWSVTPADGASIDSNTGVFTVSASAPSGAVFTVRAKVQGKCGYRDVSVKVYVFTSESNPFVGIWREKEQIDCNTGAFASPFAPIGEIRFDADGMFSVTWTPFEVYKDYWGIYEYDLSSSELFLTVIYGNYVPSDFYGKGSFYTNEKGELILENIWLGSCLYKSFPVSCGHVLSKDSLTSD